MTIQKLINKLKSLPESDKHTEISSCFIPAIVHATNLTYNSAKVYQYDSRDTHVLINVDHIVSIQPPIEAPLAVDKEEHDRILISVTNQEMNERVSISYADYLKLIS